MTMRICRLGVTVALALAALVGSGCTNSDPLSSHPGLVKTTVDVSPAGAAGFESFILTLQQISLQSLSAGADTSVGDPYGVMPLSIGMNFAVGGPRSAGSTQLSPGRYRLFGVSFKYTQNPGLFFSANVPRPASACDPSNCLDWVIYRMAVPADPDDPEGPRLNGKLPPTEVAFAAAEIPIEDIPGAPEIQIPDSGQRAITVTFNGAAMAQLFRNGMTCQCGGACGAGTVSVPAPCVSLFTTPPVDQIAPLITVSVQ